MPDAANAARMDIDNQANAYGGQQEQKFTTVPLEEEDYATTASGIIIRNAALNWAAKVSGTKNHGEVG